MRILGVILILLGIVAFVVRGVTYNKEHHVIDAGPIHAGVTEKKTVPLSPVVGALAIVAGLVLVVADSRRST